MLRTLAILLYAATDLCMQSPNLHYKYLFNWYYSAEIEINLDTRGFYLTIVLLKKANLYWSWIIYDSNKTSKSVNTSL